MKQIKTSKVQAAENRRKKLREELATVYERQKNETKKKPPPLSRIPPSHPLSFALAKAAAAPVDLGAGSEPTADGKPDDGATMAAAAHLHSRLACA